MKIYIANKIMNTIDQKNLEKNLKKFKQNIKDTKYYQLLFSSEGIYKIENNQFYKQIYVSKDSKKLKFKQIEFICDNSFVLSHDCNKLPYQFNKVKIEEEEYFLENNSSIKLIVERKNNEFFDIYFKLNRNNEDIHGFEEDILEFYHKLF